MELKNVRLALAFKDFAVWCNSSCVGLNVAGYATAKVLRKHGVDVTVFPVRHNVDLFEAIDKYNDEHEKPLTHVVISAPWLSLHDLKALVSFFPDIRFVVLSHSNVGFLQADSDGVELLRRYIELSEFHSNFTVGANSGKLAEWMEHMFGERIVHLPNLYPLDGAKEPKRWNRTSPIKIGAFGAVRSEKNFMTAAAAAVAIGKFLARPVELHMSAGGEGGGAMTKAAIQQLCHNLPRVTLVQHPWELWNKFVERVGEMDLLLQPSYTESFNMVTADGIWAGVPSVVSTAITWAPKNWTANSDDAMDIAKKGVDILLNGNRGEGFRALHHHNQSSIDNWIDFLTENRHKKPGIIEQITERLTDLF